MTPTLHAQLAADPTPDAVKRARAHLRAALVQVISTDDQIIVDHMRDAYRLLGGGDL